MSADHSDLPKPWVRLLLTGLALCFSGIIALSAWLTPDPRGFGTHQQLGLPPCFLREYTGVSCPHCGMTTSFSQTIRGDFDQAWSANPLGAPLFLAVSAAIPWLLVTAATGHWFLTNRPFRIIVWTAILFGGGTVLMWIIRLLF